MEKGQIKKLKGFEVTTGFCMCCEYAESSTNKVIQLLQ